MQRSGDKVPLNLKLSLGGLANLFLMGDSGIMIKFDLYSVIYQYFCI